jgi:hypothetical protein
VLVNARASRTLLDHYPQPITRAEFAEPTPASCGGFGPAAVHAFSGVYQQGISGAGECE